MTVSFITPSDIFFFTCSTFSKLLTIISFCFLGYCQQKLYKAFPKLIDGKQALSCLIVVKRITDGCKTFKRLLFLLTVLLGSGANCEGFFAGLRTQLSQYFRFVFFSEKNERPNFYEKEHKLAFASARSFNHI